MSEKIHIRNTKSICRKCFRVIDAEVYQEDGRVFLKKACPEHGTSSCRHIYDLPHVYEDMRRIFGDLDGRCSPRGLMLYITKRCNLSCPVCYVNAHAQDMREPTLADINKILDGYSGAVVNISGGEPTLRADLFEIIKLIKKRGFIVSVSTNGLRLLDKRYIKDLKEAGLDFIILSFDSLNDACYRALRDRPLLKDKRTVVSHAKEVGLPIYLYMVVAAGLNDREVRSIIEYAAINNDVAKILGLHPVYRMGRYNNMEAMHASQLLKTVEAAGFDPQDVMKHTELGYLLCYIGRVLWGERRLAYDPCGQRLFLVCDKGKVSSLSRVVDIDLILTRLKRLKGLLEGKRNVFLKWFFAMALFPKRMAIGAMFRNEPFRSYIERVLKRRLGMASNYPSNRWPFLEVRINYFFDWDIADLDFMQRCTLFASKDDSVDIECACMRQMRSEYGAQ